MSQEKTIQAVLDYPVVPVFFNADPATCLSVLQAAYAGGVRVFEFTNRGNNAFATFQKLVSAAAEHPDYIVGAGTIFSGNDAEAFIEAGAKFIVSPCFVESVSDVCYQNKIPYMPGCMTVKEVHYALQAGCEIIKVFPGEVVGPAFVKAVKAVLPEVRLMVTGGVAPTKESMTQWFAAGVSAVGMGSLLFKKEWLQNGNFESLQQAFGQCFEFLK